MPDHNVTPPAADIFITPHHGTVEIKGKMAAQEQPNGAVITATSAVIAEGHVLSAKITGAIDALTPVPQGFLLDAFLPSELAEDRLYAILGRYPYWVAKHGHRKARVIFATQSLGSIIGYWADWILKRLETLRVTRRS